MTTRRLFTGRLLCTSLALSAAMAMAPSLATAQSKLKVAAIYTVPFEQQWVSRIHKALKAAEARGEIEYKASENVSNADYERVMREYATGGNQLIVGEAFAVEAAARKVAKDFPKTSFLMGSSGKPQAPNFSVFDNYIQEPAYLSGMVAGGMTKTNKIGLVGGFHAKHLAQDQLVAAGGVLAHDALVVGVTDVFAGLVFDLAACFGGLQRLVDAADPLLFERHRVDRRDLELGLRQGLRGRHRHGGREGHGGAEQASGEDAASGHGGVPSDKRTRG